MSARATFDLPLVRRRCHRWRCPQVATMSADARFRAGMLSYLLLAGASMVYYLVADIHTPAAPEARITHHVTQIAPDVSGRVVEALTRNNKRVKLADMLFRIDPDSYRTAVHAAEPQVERAMPEKSQLDAAVASAAAGIRRAREQLDDAQRELGRFRDLVGDRYVSISDSEQAKARRDSATAPLQATRETLNSPKVQQDW